jgi:ubiquinol-cytochrome c reductase cytochrome b subunit
MRILKSHPLLKLVNSYIIDSPQPSNISYLWNFGSLLATCLIIQIVTGVTLAMHYNPSVLEAFNSVEHIMRDVNNGWLIRYLHSNTASAFFFLVYLHMGRGLYYGSYRAPRTLVWTIGVVIFLLMIVTGFLGYVLPYGQMSLWGATVITNLMSAIPWIGQDIVEFLWGGFSVNNATLNRFFALHFVLPFVLAALALMHLIALHDSAGSGNPLGVSGNYDRLPFAPYFLFKDLITIFIFFIALSILVFFMPNLLGDSDNYIMANPMQTPPAIVPEWYLLPFYAILRSIPNKLLGVIAMLASILILLSMPFTDLSRSRGIQFRPLSKVAFYIFIANFLVLMVLGAKHVESPFIEFGQISTVIYFSHFLIIVPLISLLENSLVELTNNSPKSVLLYSSELSFENLFLLIGINKKRLPFIYIHINNINRVIPVILLFMQCLLLINNTDLSFILDNLNIIESDYMFDSNTVMYDPVREAANSNIPTARNSDGKISGTPWGDPLGGPDRKPIGDCSVLDNQETDTRRLANYLADNQGKNMSDAKIEPRIPYTAAPNNYYSRIWAHVKAEHPEFLTSPPVGASSAIFHNHVTPIDYSLLDKLYTLNKNYCQHWPDQFVVVNHKVVRHTSIQT